MLRSKLWRSTLWLTFGLGVGVLSGFGLACFSGQFVSSTPVQATSTQGQDSFAIATGEVDDNVEALYFLDFLTGQLKAAILNPRNGKFTAFYTYEKVFDDLDIKGVKNPKFLMVTGLTDMRRGTGTTKLSKGVIYITELTSGKIGAYAVPFNATKFAAGTPIQEHLVPLDAVPSRTVAIRPGS